MQRHFEKGRNRAVAHVAGIFAERPFGFDDVGGNGPFDDDFRRRRHEQIDRFRLNQLHGRAGETAGQTIFVKVVGNFCRRRIGDARHHADGDAGLEPLALGFAFAPVLAHVLGDETNRRRDRAL